MIDINPIHLVGYGVIVTQRLSNGVKMAYSDIVSWCGLRLMT